MVMLLKYTGDKGEPDLDVEIDDRNLPSRREAFMRISRRVAGPHDRAKRISPDMVSKAVNNEPFEDFARAVYGYEQIYNKGGEARDRFNREFNNKVEEFLRRIFNSLTYIPEVSFEIGSVASDKERQAVEEAVASYRKANFRGQAVSVERQYRGLCTLRIVLGHVSQKNRAPVDTIVPSRYLPELLVAAPVWFVESKEEIKKLCDFGKSDRFAYFFQMYNDLPRFFYQLEGQDILPLPIVQLITQVSSLFDYLVIATPYHDLVTPGLKWIRNIDPFLFGFLTDVSGTGLFPLIGDMIADTMEHINKYNKYWKYWLKERDDKFVDNILRHFDKGDLFAWLRGESN
jgi:hypothetical protein